MKRFLGFFILTITLFYQTTVYAQLEAVPVEQIAQWVESTKFEYKGKAVLFGYYSTKSCVWASSDILFIEHYCEMGKNYPARSFSVWSKKIGWLQFYQEQFTEVVAKNIRINEFPNYMAAMLPDNLLFLNVDDVSVIMEKLYNQMNPACWSTNWDANSQQPEMGCYKTSIQDYLDWQNETQKIVNDPKLWNAYWQRFLSQP